MKPEVSQDYKLSKQHMVADMVDLKLHFLVHMFTFKLHLLKNGQGENCIYLLQESYFFLNLSLCETLIYYVTKTEIWSFRFWVIFLLLDW